MRMRRLRLAVAAAVLMAASACSVSGAASMAPPAGTASGSGAALPGTYPGDSEAPVPAVPVRGRAVIRPGVVRLALTDVRGIAADGGRFTLTAAAGGRLPVGSTFLIPNVAARTVTAVQTSGGAALVDTEPAAVDAVFSDLDVSFDGAPAAGSAIVGGDPVVAAGDTAVGSADGGSGADAASSPGASSGAVTTTSTSGLRRETAAGPCTDSERSLSLAIDDITVTPSFGRTADCQGAVFGAEVAATKGIVSLGLTFRATVAVSRITGHVTGGSSGDSTSVSLKVKANGTASGSAKANEPGGAEKRFKISWDLLKEDYQINIDGVPFLVRVGVPFIVEPRFSGGGDSMIGKLADFTCDGVLSVAGAEGEKDVCTAAAVGVDTFTSIAPSAFVVAMGLKIGFGPGIALKKKAQVFGGIIGTAAYSVGVSTTGATSAGLLDCVRVDRGLAFYAGIEAALSAGKYTVSTSRQVWSKSATNSYGSRCPGK